MKIASNFQLLLGFVVLFAQHAKPVYFSIQYGSHYPSQHAKHDNENCLYVFSLVMLMLRLPGGIRPQVYLYTLVYSMRSIILYKFGCYVFIMFTCLDNLVYSMIARNENCWQLFAFWLVGRCCVCVFS